MLRRLVDWSLQGMARARPRVRTKAGVVKVNLGGGLEVAPGWINVDGSVHALLAGAPVQVLRVLYRQSGGVKRFLSETEYLRRLTEHEFIFADFTNGIPFQDHSVDYVFCSHVLEHFHAADGLRLLSEVRRVLKQGGIARICVPDLARALDHYQRGDKHAALAYFFKGEHAGFDQHRYMYDYELLAAAMSEAGFSEIRQCHFREGSVPDLDQLDNRPEQTLYVEGTKA